MIATHLIQQIIDLSVRLTGDEITPQEEQVLNNSSIEELQAKVQFVRQTSAGLGESRTHITSRKW